jgi:hypothetical protein
VARSFTDEQEKRMAAESRIGYARRLEHHRRNAGKTIDEAAALIGLPLAAYRDLEMYDDELMDCISLEALSRLSTALCFDLRHFFRPEATTQVVSITFSQLVEHVQLYLREHKMTVSEFEDKAGWEVAQALVQPDEFLKCNLTGLMDICNVLGLDWISLLRPSRAQPTS